MILSLMWILQGKFQGNIEILKENYANFTYILPITIVNAKSFIKRLQISHKMRLQFKVNIIQ
jgi:hypothetical protein